ncbi:MAG: FprA family A-type flavoprotein [Acidilobus sp.]
MRDLSGPVEVTRGVYWVGVNDRAKLRFENMWPIPLGISYNAYVVSAGNLFVAVDGVEEGFSDEYFSKLEAVVQEPSKVKFVIVNHLEPDHQGTLEELVRRSGAKVIISNIGAKMIGDFYDVPAERVAPVSDGQALQLGDKSFRFIYTPWLHWPETMVTLDETDGVLFTCDVFGSYRALDAGLFDDEVPLDEYVSEAKRYYVNIVGKYSRNTLDALKKLTPLLGRVKVVAPAHGPLYRANVPLPFNLYEQWARPTLEREVSVVYISMYGHSVNAVKRLAESIRSAGVRVRLLDAAEQHLSYIISEANNSAAVIVVFPTYDASIPMPLYEVLYTFQVKMFGRGRPAGVVTSYGWGPVAKQAAEALQKAGFKVVEPLVTLRTRPKADEVSKLDELTTSIVKAVDEAMAKAS